MLENAKNIPNYRLTVSLEEQTVTDERGFKATFEVDPFRKFCLMVEKEDSVYPMIPAGSALHEMIRRPGKNPLVESQDDV